jgi:hypothetical protein
MNFLAGNFVKLVSRHNTTTRSDLNRPAKLERIRFYIKKSIESIDKDFFKACGLRMELEKYILTNNFNENQRYLFEIYFFAILEKDALNLLKLSETIESFL